MPGRIVQWRSRALLAFLVVAGAPRCAAGHPAKPAYEISSSPDVEVLSLFYTGGMRFHTIRYRLFGDGGLVREVELEYREGVLGCGEAHLPEGDVESIVQRLVEAGLPEMKGESLRRSLGHEPLWVGDGATSIVKLRFESYRGPGGKREPPFTPRVSLHAPDLQARSAPDAPEPRAFVALRETLEGYFETTVAECWRTAGER